MPGQPSDAKPSDSEAQAVFDAVIGSIAEKLGDAKADSAAFTLVTYKKQVVNGTNYFIKGKWCFFLSNTFCCCSHIKRTISSISKRVQPSLVTNTCISASTSPSKAPVSIKNPVNPLFCLLLNNVVETM
jgi:hypothetical protein